MASNREKFIGPPPSTGPVSRVTSHFSPPFYLFHCLALRVLPRRGKLPRSERARSRLSSTAAAASPFLTLFLESRETSRVNYSWSNKVGIKSRHWWDFLCLFASLPPPLSLSLFLGVLCKMSWSLFPWEYFIFRQLERKIERRLRATFTLSKWIEGCNFRVTARILRHTYSLLPVSWS